MTQISVFKGEKFLCRAEVADNFLSRAKGLMFKQKLGKNKGLLMRFSFSRSIHSFFMRFPIDLIFLDKQKTVVELKTLKPWKFYFPTSQSTWVLEMEAGAVKENAISIGDKLEF